MHLATRSLIGAMILTMLLGSGCSLLFVHGPPEDHATLARFDCTESNAVPVLDVIWAGLNGLGAASVDGANPQHDQIVGVGVAWLVVSGISAVYGFTKVSHCNDAKRQRDQRYYPGGITAAPDTERGPAQPSTRSSTRASGP